MEEAACVDPLGDVQEGLAEQTWNSGKYTELKMGSWLGGTGGFELHW
jgi:hypothetical protein